MTELVYIVQSWYQYFSVKVCETYQ